MKKLFIIILYTLTHLSVAGQDNAIVVGNRRDNPKGGMIVQLKFMFPGAVVSNHSINIYRKLFTAGNWEKINAVPVLKTDIDKPNSANGVYNAYRGFISRKSMVGTQAEKNANVMGGLMMLGNNEFAQYAGCYFEDKNVVEGETYQYRITDAANQDKELAVSGSFKVKDNYLPVVSNIKAQQKKQAVLLNWDKNKTFYAYKVYVRTNHGEKATLLTPKAVLVGSVKGKEVEDNLDAYKFIDTSVSDGSILYYTVTGIDMLGNESAMAPDVKIVIKDMVPPPVIQNLKAQKKDKTVTLTWSVPGGKDVTGYNIFRNSTNDTTYKKISGISLPATTTTYNDVIHGEGIVFGYYIETVDATGNTSKSRATMVFFPDQAPPAVPTGLKATCWPGIIDLSWNSNKEPDLLGYYIYRSSTSDKEYFNLLNREPFKENRFIDSLPGVAKNEFIYYIQAVDKRFNKSDFSDTVIAFLPDTMAPHAPYLKEIVSTNGLTNLSWEKVADKDVIGYNIYKTYDSLSGTYQKINNLPINEIKFTDKALPSPICYYYVKAIDDAGNISHASNKRILIIESETTESTPAENIHTSFNATDTSIYIEWKNTSREIKGYAVYRKEDEDENFIAVSGVISANNYMDKDIEPDKQYYYMIRSFFIHNDAIQNSMTVKLQSK